MYDGNEHTPKLLPCSHTVCLHCLSRIAASQTRDTGSFRCPICRELITIPRGGVSALPPSFLVNQLLDLMSRQRREVIPKCSVHINQVQPPTANVNTWNEMLHSSQLRMVDRLQSGHRTHYENEVHTLKPDHCNVFQSYMLQELLFCETCDTVFCTLCTGGSHSTSGTSCEHTIIPFSIAIKRMSEILLYKANECISKVAVIFHYSSHLWLPVTNLFKPVLFIYL